MRSFGYLFILFGIAAMRQVLVGRVSETPQDAADFFNALVSGDMDTVGEVASRRGDNVSAESDTVAATDSADTSNGISSYSGGIPLVQEMKKLGNATVTATSPNGKYVWGAVGPSSYDCSGIVWRACKNLGIYDGPRFTTSTFRSVAGSWAKPVSAPSVGDIVLWEGKHMGVVIGQDGLYSARSPAKGIGPSTISGDSESFGIQPSYWRVS